MARQRVGQEDFSVEAEPKAAAGLSELAVPRHRQPVPSDSRTG
jgi:hypothetical protein